MKKSVKKIREKKNKKQEGKNEQYEEVFFLKDVRKNPKSKKIINK